MPKELKNCSAASSASNNAHQCTITHHASAVRRDICISAGGLCTTMGKTHRTHVNIMARAPEANPSGPWHKSREAQLIVLYSISQQHVWCPR